MPGTYIGSKATLAASALTTGDGLVVIDVSAADVRIVEWSDFRGLFVGSPGADPNADRLLFWDDSAGAYAYLTPGANLTITGTTLDATGGTSLPVDDSTAIVKGSSDATKQLRFEVDGFTTGATRTITVPNVSSTMAVLTTNQTFTGTQTFSSMVASNLTLSSYLFQDNARLTGGTLWVGADNALAATGTTFGTAAPSLYSITRVTSATGGVADGVIPLCGLGDGVAVWAFVSNETAAPVKLYPASALGQINSLGTGNPYTLAAGAQVVLVGVSGTQQYTISGAMGALLAASNLSDLASAATSRTNLGVTATGADTAYAFRANNLSDLASASTARTNLGLGTAATQNTGTSGATVPLLNAGNTFSATQVVEGTLTARQSGGVAGTDEVQIYDDGTHSYIVSKNAELRLGGNGGTERLRINGSEVIVTDVMPTSDLTRHLGSAALQFADLFVRDVYLDAANACLRFNDARLVRAGAQVLKVTGSALADPGGLSSPARTPNTLTADQNDYSPGVGWFQRWTSDASRNVTGMAAGQDGEARYVWNVGAQNIVLQNEHASSSAANRFTTSTGADLTLAVKRCALMMYDAGSSRWRVTLLP